MEIPAMCACVWSNNSHQATYRNQSRHSDIYRPIWVSRSIDQRSCCGLCRRLYIHTYCMSIKFLMQYKGWLQSQIGMLSQLLRIYIYVSLYIWRETKGAEWDCSKWTNEHARVSWTEHSVGLFGCFWESFGWLLLAEKCGKSFQPS